MKQRSTFLGCWHAASQQRRHSWGQPEVEWIGIFSVALLSPIPNRPPSSKVNLTPKPPADVPLRTKCVASNKLKWWLRWFITFLTISTLIIDQWSLISDNCDLRPCKRRKGRRGKPKDRLAMERIAIRLHWGVSRSGPGVACAVRNINVPTNKQKDENVTFLEKGRWWENDGKI